MENHPEDEVVNFDKLTYAGNLENLNSVKKNPHYTFIQGDTTNPDDVEKAINGVDIIVHFAAESHVDRSVTDPSAFVKTNVLGTQVMLNAARIAQIKRFHHVSTDEVFGSLSLESKEKFTENSRYDPHSPYSASKAGSDHLVRAYHDTFGVPITISNCANNFGPYMFPEKLFSLAITNLIEGKKVPVYGDGLNVRDWLHVEDHCRAIDMILQKGKVGETYCIGSQIDHEYSNLEAIRLILKIMGKGEEMIEFVKDRPGHDRRYAIDWTKIRTELGWEPKHSFEEWMKKTVTWYQENQEWWKKIKSGEYQTYYKEQYGK
jgi:dTDP-glucose 4,6-dehydratase